MTNQPQFLSGKLLLAMPGMADPRFERAAIAIAVHDENGAIGIGVGHVRSGIRFRDLLKQLDVDPLDAPDVPVLHGGPVEPSRGFVLHSEDWVGEDTLPVPGLGAMSGTIEVLRAIAQDKGPAHWLVALGYAGWAPAQLESEMTRHGWLAASGSPTLLFDVAAEDRWSAAFKSEGIDPRLLASESGAA